MGRLAPIVVAIWALRCVVATHGQCTPQQTAQLQDADGAAHDAFGTSVAIDGSTTIVGAYSNDTAQGTDAGSATVFERSATRWTEQAELTASDGMPSDYFAWSVGLNDDTAVVGAYAADTLAGADVGAAYVLIRGGDVWTEDAKLFARNGTLGDAFGYAVAIDADTVVVGSPDDDASGSAYVFVRNGGNWAEQALLTPSDGAKDGYFGFSVAVDGQTVLVGSYLAETVDGPEAGAAYVFTRIGETWMERTKLTASDGAPFGWFGHSVAIHAGTAIVGAARADLPQKQGAGSAYVFVLDDDTWKEQAKLTPTSPAAFDWFGFSVALHDDTAVVTALLGDKPPSADTGSAFVFGRDGDVWTETAKVTASDLESFDAFGSFAAIDGSTLVVGASLDETPGGAGSGSAYVFDLQCECAADCNDDGSLNIFDFLCFQGLVTTGDPAADCNGDTSINIFDFLCFQGLVTKGC